jgi:hypothetical protein
MLWRLDLVLRFLYVLIAPVFLVAFAAMIPMTGPLVGAGLATVIALAGSDRWRARTERIPLVGRPLANLASLGDYYREHPPRPLLYYVLYPALFPYWLFNRNARREFLLYRKINVIALILIPALAALEYVQKWSGIPFSAFLSQTIATLVLQLLVTFALVMPIVTTIVAYHARGKRKTLTVMILLAGLLAAGMAIHAMRSDRPSFYTVERMRYRALADRKQAVEVLWRALSAGAAWLDAGASADPEAALEAARAELETYWLADEARVFKLYRASDGATILYVNPRGHATIWIGRAKAGKPFFDAKLLPPDGRAKLKAPVVH